jgi:hypothetical protein
MTKHKFQDIWKQQCVAARNIRVQHGVLSALDYLIAPMSPYDTYLDVVRGFLPGRRTSQRGKSGGRSSEAADDEPAEQRQVRPVQKS